MIRMLVESDSRDEAADGIPDSLQALIAARIDSLPGAQKTLLQRASVVGRVFWKAAIEHVSPDLEDVDVLLEELLAREFLLREARSSISGEKAYRFKHQLIREVAYTSLAKLARAQHHARFAEWLGERAGEELLEIRAYHLDQAVEFLTELEGAPPSELADETASALVKAATRAMARESYASARKLGVRALELRPTLDARYVAARAAWRLQDLATVEVEMGKVRDEARLEGDRVLEAIALTALAEARMRREADPRGATELVDEALELLHGEDAPAAHFDALSVRATSASWRGDIDDAILHFERAFTVAMDSGRKDLQTIASQALAQLHVFRLELDEAELLITRALELAGESGSVRGRIGTTLSYGKFLEAKGELDAAETIFEEVRGTAAELGLEAFVVHAVTNLGWLARRRGDVKRAEKLLREAVRMTAARGDRGALPEVQALLACTLVEAGRIDEAERLAVEARSWAGAEDPSAVVAAAAALGDVRAAQGRDEEAEELIREALTIAEASPFAQLETEPLELLARFLRERGREDEACAYEARLTELLPWTSTARIA
jgi:tetratricopeptide (TPR) repeat protein